MSISCSNITYSRECFWTVPFIRLWSLFVLVEPLPALPATALRERRLFPNTRLHLESLCHTGVYLQTKNPNPEKRNPTKICLSGSGVFIKPKWREEQQFLLDAECWEQLGAELGGDFSGKQREEQGYGQGIQQQIWDPFEKLWGCTKQDIVSAHFPRSSPRWQQFPVLRAGKMMLTFVRGGIVWCELCWPLEQPWQGLCAGKCCGLAMDLGWQGWRTCGIRTWASLKARYRTDLNMQEEEAWWFLCPALGRFHTERLQWPLLSNTDLCCPSTCPCLLAQVVCFSLIKILHSTYSPI